MKRSPYIVGLVLLIFFVISLLTNIIGPIIPDIIRSFGLSLGAAALLPFSFFIAYGVMSIPAGLLIEKYGAKLVIVTAFAAAFGGALVFALSPVYSTAIPTLFAIGVAMAMLQVAINPLLRVAGGEENFAFFAAFSQLVFGLASFLSPRVYSYLVTSLGSHEGVHGLILLGLSRAVPQGLPWVSLYWIFAVVALVMTLVVAASRFPRVDLTDEERIGTWATHRKLLRNPVVVMYFASVFAYVGAEQGTSVWISQFLATYHGYNPQTAGANAVSWFWGLMTAGCFVGMVLLKLFDSRKVLIAFSACAVAALSVALFGSGPLSLIAFPLVGLFASVMWPIIVSLGLNSVAEHHGSVSGILCTAIAGGAVVPLIIGRLGDRFGLRAGMLFLYLVFGWILAIGFWARPIITNKTLTAGATQE